MASFRQDGKVSLWLCCKKHSVDSDPLKELFGIEYYDVDELEPAGDWKLQPVENLFVDLSFADSFKTSAIEAAQKSGVSKARFLIALFNFAYDPNAASVELPDDPVYLGAFDWVDNA